MRERATRSGRQYAAIPNEMMRNASLSMEARGLLALLMTYSDEWQFSRDHLMGVTDWGKDKFGKVMGELIEQNYVEVVYLRDANGTMLGRTWTIKDSPSEVREMPTTDATVVRENRCPGKPLSGESAPIRKPIDQEDQKERIPQTPDGAGDDLFSAKDLPTKKRSDEPFERFWKAYPKKVGKPGAVKNFARAVKHGADPEEIIAGAERYATAMGGKDPGYVKHPQGWLTDQRWLDQPEEDLPPSLRTGGHRLRENWGEIVR